MSYISAPNFPQAEEYWVSHVHTLSEDELTTAGQRSDEDLDGPALLLEEDKDAEQGPEVGPMIWIPTRTKWRRIDPEPRFCCCAHKSMQSLHCVNL